MMTILSQATKENDSIGIFILIIITDKLFGAI